MKSAALTILLLSLAKQALAFSSISSSSLRSTTTTAASTSPLFATANNDDDNSLSRRDLFTQTISLTAAATTLGLFSPLTATADDTKPAASTVVVAGATGQTGRRVLERLASQPNTSVIAAVRNTDKASKSLSESSTVVRGAMIQKVPSLDAAGIELRKLDVASDTTDSITAVLAGADSLVIAVGFVPGNPLKMNAAAHEVDNVGTCKLIDAAKAAGVKK
eukprot:scaffold12482_cov60-Skeletonema_dohrnii-CCMP3373.AAC.1